MLQKPLHTLQLITSLKAATTDFYHQFCLFLNFKWMESYSVILCSCSLVQHNMWYSYTLLCEVIHFISLGYFYCTNTQFINPFYSCVMMGIWVVSSLGLLRIKLLRTSLYIYLVNIYKIVSIGYILRSGTAKTYSMYMFTYSRCCQRAF